MILTCPSCAAHFNVNPSALGETGRTVRCGKCKHQWHATRPLITMPADDAEPKASGVTTAAPSVDTAKVAAGVALPPQAASAPKEEPPAPAAAEESYTSNFHQASYDDEDAMAPLPAYGSEMAPVARRNAVIAAVLLAGLLSIPVFLMSQKTDAPSVDETAKTVEAPHEEKKEDSITLEGTPTTLLKEDLGRTILSIDGVLINKTDKTLEVPVLQAQALNAKGKVVKEWIIPIGLKEMAPGQRQPFSYSLPFTEQGVVDIAFHFL